MAEVTNSFGVSIDVPPITSADDKGNGKYGVSLVKLHMFEKIGGELAGGDMELLIGKKTNQEEVVQKLNELNTATIKMIDKGETGMSYEIPIFITSRKYTFNQYNISFVCISDIKFTTDFHTVTFDNISDALDSLYPGEKDIRIKCDVDNLVKLYQCTETDYEFCKKLAQSYKRNSIFAFGWEGLLIKDLCGEFDSLGNKEPYIEITDKKYRMTGATEKAFDEELNVEPRDLWEGKFSGVRSRFATSSKQRNNYTIQARDNAKLADNYLFNGRILGGRMYSLFYTKVFKMPGYKLGDAVLYKRNETQDTTTTQRFVCVMNEIFFSTGVASERDSDGYKYSWRSAFLGLDRGEWSGEEKESGEIN